MIQHELVVVGLHEQRAILAQLGCSMGRALWPAHKDDLQPGDLFNASTRRPVIAAKMVRARWDAGRLERLQLL